MPTITIDGQPIAHVSDEIAGELKQLAARSSTAGVLSLSITSPMPKKDMRFDHRSPYSLRAISTHEEFAVTIEARFHVQTTTELPA